MYTLELLLQPEIDALVNVYHTDRVSFFYCFISFIHVYFVYDFIVCINMAIGVGLWSITWKIKLDEKWDETPYLLAIKLLNIAIVLVPRMRFISRWYNNLMSVSMCVYVCMMCFMFYVPTGLCLKYNAFIHSFIIAPLQRAGILTTTNTLTDMRKTGRVVLVQRCWLQLVWLTV